MTEIKRLKITKTQQNPATEEMGQMAPHREVVEELATDAGENSLGAVFMQKQEGIMKSLAFHSKRLNVVRATTPAMT